MFLCLPLQKLIVVNILDVLLQHPHLLHQLLLPFLARLQLLILDIQLNLKLLRLTLKHLQNIHHPLNILLILTQSLLQPPHMLVQHILLIPLRVLLQGSNLLLLLVHYPLVNYRKLSQLVTYHMPDPRVYHVYVRLQLTPRLHDLLIQIANTPVQHLPRTQHYALGLRVTAHQ